MRLTTDIFSRSRRALHYRQYESNNAPLRIAKLPSGPATKRIGCPYDRQYILRMLIKRYNDNWCLPEELNWCRDIIRMAEQHQMSLGLMQPFVYITIRHGIVTSKTDDVWHLDGFSMRITHLPEQNYIWSDKMGTQWLQQPFVIPKEFHPLKHNINSIFQKQAKQECIQTFQSNSIYFVDPYVVHRRNPATQNKQRTMVRVSFLPIELRDDGNTPNPLLPVAHYGINGVEDFRNKLISL